MINGHRRVPREDVIHINHPLHRHLIADALGKPLNEEDHFACISRTLNGDLLGGAIYHHYTGPAIGIHVASASPRWLTRNALYVAFAYPFDQLRVTKLIGVVPAINLPALAFDKALGFVEEATLQDVVPGGAAVILSMRREQCRWLSHKPKGLVVIQHRESPYGELIERTAGTRPH